MRAFLLTLLVLPSIAQTTAPKPDKPQPPATLPWLVLDSVAADQWPATLPLVNAPTNLELLNPGQCVRAAVLVSGGGQEHALENATLSWSVSGLALQSFPAAPLTPAKHLKPEGLDFVAFALAAGGIRADISTSFASMAASNAKWCVPQGAADGKVEVRMTLQQGTRQTVLKPVSITIESLATGAAKTFASLDDMAKFSTTYHVAPEPARLLPAFQFIAGGSQDSLVPYAFFRAAFKQDAPTVQGFGPALAASPKLTEMIALNLLAKTGVILTPPPPLSDDDKKAIAAADDLFDPYDMKPTQDLFTKLDFLWAEFCADGRRKPVAAIVSALAWRADYDAFQALKKSGKKPGALTDSLVRGLTYMAAGWSLNSFNQSDPLAADYLAAISADPATPANIKAELAHLGDNPAFKR